MQSENLFNDAWKLYKTYRSIHLVFFMLFTDRPIDLNDHVLIVLGPKGHPTFKTIHLNEAYLDEIGKELVVSKSQYIEYKVISSHNVFTLTNPDYVFDHAVDMIIRNMILNQSEKDMRYNNFW